MTPIKEKKMEAAVLKCLQTLGYRGTSQSLTIEELAKKITEEVIKESDKKF